MADEPEGPADASTPSKGALLRAEVLDLAQSRLPFAGVAEDIRPRAADPLFELGRILGPELVCLLVKEAERIHDQQANTHIDVRLHFLEGSPRRADWMPVRAVAMGRNGTTRHR